MGLIEIKGVSKSYSGKTALDNVNLTLERGQIVGLLGPNGSGKTTLIKLMMGLLKQDAGTITIDGHEPGANTKAITSFLSDHMAMPKYMKVGELIVMYEDFFADFDKENAIRMLNDLGIDVESRFKALSKGNKEKVQLILTMSRKAEVYLLDEPIGGVDPATRDYILKTIISNYSRDAVLIISTHLIADVESVLDDIIFLKEGQIVVHESTEALRDEKGMSINKLFREVFKC